MFNFSRKNKKLKIQKMVKKSELEPPFIHTTAIFINFKTCS